MLDKFQEQLAGEDHQFNSTNGFNGSYVFHLNLKTFL